jgi:Ca2+:H+ antiporter
MFDDDDSGPPIGSAAQPSPSSPPPSLGPGSSPPPDEPLLSWPAALLALAAITVVVAAGSEFLTASLEEVSSSWGISRAFLGVIVLPIAGNACEHITAVIVAAKNKMDLAMGVAVGSSIQIALLAVPLAVLAGWAMGRPFSLSFDPFGTLALTVAVVHANLVMGDATSNWLLGVQLLATYALIGTVYAFR